MEILQRPFGVTSDSKEIWEFEIRNSRGVYARILNYGCILTSLGVPDKNGTITDIVLGYDTLEEYEKDDQCFGAVVGRCANVISGGEIHIGEKNWQLSRNMFPDHLHGGYQGFHKKAWNFCRQKDRLLFTRLSPNMEEGYPGNLWVMVSYALSEQNELEIQYEAISDQDTLVNLTSHSYFNLSGDGTLSGHELMLRAEEYSELDSHGRFTGRMLPVRNTPYDFTSLKRLEIPDGAPGGYDHYFSVSSGSAPAAVLKSSASGIAMEMRTTLPGLQVYTANELSAVRGKSGRLYGKHSGICLEAQFCPDPWKFFRQPAFLLKKGNIYFHKTSYRFYQEHEAVIHS